MRLRIDELYDCARHLPIIAGRHETRAFLLTLSFVRGFNDELETFHC